MHHFVVVRLSQSELDLGARICVEMWDYLAFCCNDVRGEC